MQVTNNVAAADRKLSYGEKAVGLSFNPSGDPWVNDIKARYAAVIDDLNSLREFAKARGETEKCRQFSIAITEAQTSQFWAVKAITWRE